MHRKEVIKKLLTLIEEEDLVIFIGESICEEVYIYDKKNYFYLMDNFDLSFAVGVANSVNDNNRVFVVFDDSVILESFSQVFQVLLSNNINLFLFFLYNVDGIFKKFSNIQGIFFNIGIQSFLFDSYFKSAESIKKLRKFVLTAKGPKVYIVGTKLSNRRKALTIDKDPVFFRNRFNNTINKLIGAID